MAVPSARYQAWIAKGRKPSTPRKTLNAVRHPNPKRFIEIPRCQAATRSGEQCKLEAQPGRDFCAMHKDAQ